MRFMTAVLCFTDAVMSLTTALLCFTDAVMSLTTEPLRFARAPTSPRVAALRVTHALASLGAARMSKKVRPKNEMDAPPSKRHLAPRAMAA
jgi:hypothetical protein